MGKRLILPGANTATLDEMFEMSPRTFEACIRRLTPERRQELLLECEERLEYATGRACGTGFAFCEDRTPNRFSNGYHLVKKFSYMYTCLAGYQTNADLEMREMEMGILVTA